MLPLDFHFKQVLGTIIPSSVAFSNTSTHEKETTPILELFPRKSPQKENNMK
jgi:hypothetical protein